MDPVLYDSFDRLLSDISTPQVIREIESGGSPDALWQQTMESGFADAMVTEDAGGASLSQAEAFSLFFLCGCHVLPVALAPTMIARAMLARKGIDIPQGTVVERRPEMNKRIIGCQFQCAGDGEAGRSKTPRMPQHPEF